MLDLVAAWIAAEEANGRARIAVRDQRFERIAVEACIAFDINAVGACRQRAKDAALGGGQRGIEIGHEAMIGTDRYRGSRPYMERALLAAVAPKGRSYNGRAKTRDTRRGRLGATCASTAETRVGRGGVRPC